MKNLFLISIMTLSFQSAFAETCVPPKKFDKKYAKKLFKAGRAPLEADLIGSWTWLGYHYDKSLGKEESEFSCDGIKRDGKLVYVMNFFRDDQAQLNMEVVRDEHYKIPYGTGFLVRKDKMIYPFFAHHGAYITAYCRVSKNSSAQMACPLYWTDHTLLEAVKFAGLLIFEKR